MAGIIGEKKFAYDVWGDSVNIASRMESHGENGRINISANTNELIKDFFMTSHRGEIEVKNIGLIDTYTIERIHNELSRDADGLVPNEKFNGMYSILENGSRKKN
jgi:class 3 adenylate cyclase